MPRLIGLLARLRGCLLSIFSASGFNFRLCIYSPICITSRFIHFGERVLIYNNARIQGISSYQGISYAPSIVINSGVTIQQNIHLTCAESIIIGENTAIAANVTITDIDHPYLDIKTPIEFQPLRVKPVEIGADCKLYNNVVILQGVTIGKHVTIGANSVVNKSLPNYCVAVGIPAKIVKRYDFITQTWRKTDPQGNFIEK